MGAFTALSAELRGTVADGLRELSDQELADLAAAVADARHRQAAALAGAGDAIPSARRRPSRARSRLGYGV